MRKKASMLGETHTKIRKDWDIFDKTFNKVSENTNNRAQF